MFSVLTRTSNRPNYFANCRRSVLGQTLKPYHIVSTDNDADQYPEGDAIVKVMNEPGRGHNLYFNTMRNYVPADFQFIIHLDDDDKFTCPDALEIIREAIFTANSLVLWRVDMGDGRVLPERLYEPPKFGHITGIGFAVHLKNWVNWEGIPGGDFKVINHYYHTLKPVWIDEVLTAMQTRSGNGARKDLPNANH